jgi:hypothetical protein
MTLIFEIGFWFFFIVLAISIIIAIVTLVGFIVESYRKAETGDLIFAVFCTLFLISILLMLVGSLAIALF